MKTRTRDASRQTQRERETGGGFPSFCGVPEQTARNTHSDKQKELENFEQSNSM